MAVKRTCNTEMSMYSKIQPSIRGHQWKKLDDGTSSSFFPIAINVFYRCVQCTNDRQCRDSRRWEKGSAHLDFFLQIVGISFHIMQVHVLPGRDVRSQARAWFLQHTSGLWWCSTESRVVQVNVNLLDYFSCTYNSIYERYDDICKDFG